jgi:hypothetical protein
MRATPAAMAVMNLINVRRDFIVITPLYKVGGCYLQSCSCNPSTNMLVLDTAVTAVIVPGCAHSDQSELNL